MSIKEHPPLHVPVLLEDVLAMLHPQSGESYLDLTAGYGGHAGAILEQTDNYSESVLVDRDDFAIAQLDRFAQKATRLLQTSFVEAAKQLTADGQQFDVILLDLGVSSPQLDRAERGFSFSKDGPLDMRMDRRQSLTAQELVNTAKRNDLVRIIREYGEEPLGVASRYADALIAARPITSTKQLAETIVTVHVGKWQKIHPATRTFQAIRISIND